MGPLFLCPREMVQKQGRGYDFTISENESTILLFLAKRENDFSFDQFYLAAFFLQGGAGTVHRKNTELYDFFTNRVYFILWNKEKLSMTES